MGQAVDRSCCCDADGHCTAASGRLSRLTQQLYALRVSPLLFNRASWGGMWQLPIQAAITCNVAVPAVTIAAWRGAEAMSGLMLVADSSTNWQDSS